MPSVGIGDIYDIKRYRAGPPPSLPTNDRRYYVEEFQNLQLTLQRMLDAIADLNQRVFDLENP